MGLLFAGGRSVPLRPSGPPKKDDDELRSEGMLDRVSRRQHTSYPRTTVICHHGSAADIRHHPCDRNVTGMT